MSDSVFSKVIRIVFYLLIIILIVLLLDLLFSYTVRKNRKNQIKQIAEQKALELDKPLIIFNDRDNGIVISYNKDGVPSAEDFTGDILEIANQIKTDSAVVIVSETLEYIDDETFLRETIKQLNRISGGNLYVVNIEKNSTRPFWDYKIKHIMEKSYYLPNEKIKWIKPNNVQLYTQKFYSKIFTILPYRFFTYYPIKS